MIPRGVRNNNPGNIKEFANDHTLWIGERATDDDEIFEEFNTPEDGFRALAKTLKNYKRLYSICTIREVLDRFAPESDNNPSTAYKDFVCDQTRYALGEYIDLTDNAVLFDLCKAITRFEQGRAPDGADWWDDAVIREGVSRA